MTEMSRFEKSFVNRRGERAFRGLLRRADREGALRLSTDSAVLELGAGNAAFSMLLNDRYHPRRICATDYDPEQVATGRRNVERRYGTVPPVLVLERADATRMEYPDRSFDLVVAHHVLHHLGGVRDIFRGLTEITRVLRPGGQFLYVEMFHKRAIREELARLGYHVRFRRRSFRLVGIADNVIAEAPSGPTPQGVPPAHGAA